MTSPNASSNPLLAPWTGPFGGVPDFGRARLEDLEPAMEAGIAEHLAELESIAANPEPPNFANTVEAFEDSGRALSRAGAFFGIWSNSLSSPEFREIERRLAPKLSAYSSKITQNTALYKRLVAVTESGEFATLDEEQQLLVQGHVDRLTKNGANLEGVQRERYAAIGERLAVLYAEFGNHILADEEGVVHLFEAEQLAGCESNFRDSAAQLAAERGAPGKFALPNTRSAMMPFLTQATDRAAREIVWRAFIERGDHPGENDNKPVVAEILKLRRERAELLGFPTYAHWMLTDRMAKTPEAVRQLLEAVWPSATGRVAEEVAEMQALADSQGEGVTIEPWDYRFYGEQVRSARYALDAEQIKPYLQLEKLQEAMFFVAREVFGLEFREVESGQVPTFHEEVRVFEVTRALRGEHVGLFYLDPFARPGKRSGAWASTFRRGESFRELRSVLATNTSNFLPARQGSPVVVSPDDARTLFHEFGHGLHTLLADVKYPGSNNIVRDFVEFQSQLLEHYLWSDPVATKFLTHVETGKPIPRELIDKLEAAAAFHQGFATTEYLACALVDLELHTADPSGLDVAAFEAESLDRLGMPRELVMRHRTPQFAHVFSGEGYAVGYYSYLWADVLTADAAAALREAPGGLFDGALTAKLRDLLFAPRGAVDPGMAYRKFRGRDASLAALMRERGFATSAG